MSSAHGSGGNSSDSSGGDEGGGDELQLLKSKVNQLEGEKRALALDNKRLRQSNRVKDTNLRQLGIVAANGGNKASMLSHLDDAAIQKTMQGCVAIMSMIQCLLNNDIMTLYKFLPFGWFNWNTHPRSICKRCCDHVAQYVPEGYGLMTFWFMWITVQIKKSFKEKRATSCKMIKEGVLGE